MRFPIVRINFKSSLYTSFITMIYYFVYYKINKYYLKTVLVLEVLITYKIYFVINLSFI